MSSESVGKKRMIRNLAGLILLVGAGYYMVERNKTLEEMNADDLWLEEVTSERSLAWVKGENQRSLEILKSEKSFQEMQSQSEQILTRDDKLTVARQIKPGRAFNFWQDDTHIKGILRQQSWSDYTSGKSNWETVIDFDKLSEAEGKSWVYGGLSCQEDHSRCLLRLSDGGSDASYLREFDLETKDFVKDGFAAPESKSSFSWLDKDTLIAASTLSEGSKTDSGYARIIRMWRRGTALDDNPVVFEGSTKDVWVWGTAIKDQDQQHVFFGKGKSFFSNEIFYWKDGKAQAIQIPPEHEFKNLKFGELIFSLRKPYLDYQAGDLVSFSIESALTEKPEAKLLFRPTETQSLGALTSTKDYLVMQVMDQVKERAIVMKRDAGKGVWSQQDVPVPVDGSVGVFGTSPYNNDFLVSFESFLKPETLYAVDQDLSLNVVQEVGAVFDASQLAVAQKFANSKDGTKIPYFVLSKKDVKLDGKNPTVLYGYGGFEVPITPNYMGVIGKNWLEQGGVYVIANIRGGGEFGPKWHQAALKHNRHKAYEDFIAVAETIIGDKLSSPKHLAIRGGSNGGLLVGAVATQRPDLFNGVLCLVPLLDMMRYHKLLAGASWVGEYGNPEDPKDAAYIQTYSPYQQVKKEASYPEVFFITSTKDDRVHPGHARRMAHKMQTLGHQFYYYENIEGGHSASADLKQKAFQYALEFSYLKRKIGEPQRLL